MEKNSIIVGYDASATAENALQYAVDLAAHMDRNVVVAHVLKKGDDPTEKEQMLNRAIASIENESSVSIATSVIDGNPKDDLNTIAVALNAEFIALGTNRSNLWENIFGSSTMRTVKNSEVPFILINQYVSFKPVDKIGVVLDNEKESVQIVRAAANLAKPLGAEIHIIAPHYADETDAQQTDINMQVAQKYLSQLGMESKGIYVKEEEFMFYLLEYCNDVGIDIVASTYNTENFQLFSNRFVERLSEKSSGLPVLTMESEDIGVSSPFYFQQV